MSLKDLSAEAQELRKQFPSVVLLQDGRVAVQSRAPSRLVVLGAPEMIAQVTTEAERNQIERYRAGGSVDLCDLVKKEGLEREYCLVFMGKIFFHSPSKKVCDEYAKSHSSLGFTLFSPDISTGGCSGTQ